MYEEKAAFREFTKSISKGLLFLITFVRELLLGGDKIIDVFVSDDKEDREIYNYEKGGMTDGKRNQLGKDISNVADELRDNATEHLKDSMKFMKYAETLQREAVEHKEQAMELNKIQREADLYEKGGSTDFIQKVEDSPNFDKGGFSREAKKRGVSTQTLFNRVMKNPSRYSEKLRRQAQFMKNAYKFRVR